MATDIASLFGLTPEGLSQQRYQQDLKQGYELAQLSRGDAARATLQSGVGQLGRGIAGLLGVQDPQMQLMTARQQIFNQVDQSNPQSYVEAAKQLQSIGDTQGAFVMADYARKAESEIAQAKARMAQATRERQQAVPNQIQIAQSLSQYNLALDKLNAMEPSPERDEAIRTVSRTIKAIESQIEKPEKAQLFGSEREAIAKELFKSSYGDLTQEQMAAVNKRVDAEKPRTTITNVLPGDKALADIPGFRKQVQDTVKAQSQAVFAADNALENIQNSINTGNFASYRAAQTQFAKAIAGAGDLSQKELKAAGADPALLGGTADYIATLFTSTPTLDTQNKIKTTLEAIKKVSTQKARAEIEAQRKIAYSNPNFDKTRVDQALDFPEFMSTSGGSSEKKTNTRTLKSGKVVTVIEE